MRGSINTTAIPYSGPRSLFILWSPIIDIFFAGVHISKLLFIQRQQLDECALFKADDAATLHSGQSTFIEIGECHKQKRMHVGYKQRERERERDGAAHKHANLPRPCSPVEILSFSSNKHSVWTILSFPLLLSTSARVRCSADVGVSVPLSAACRDATSSSPSF